jgi:hypothetical protein
LWAYFHKFDKPKYLFPMTPEQLKDEIDFKINEGRGYQDIYDELNKTYPGREIDLARLIADVPLLAQRMKYEKHRLAMMGLVGLLFGVQLVRITFCILQDDYAAIGWAIVPTIMMICLFGLARWKRQVISVVGYLGMIVAIGYFRTYSKGDVGTDLFIDMGLLALIGWLGIEIGRGLGGKYKVKGSEQYTDTKGQIRARHKVEFQN